MTHRSQTALYLSLVAAFSLLHTTQGIISLDVSPDSILSGNRTGQNTQVVFNCSANIVSVVRWKRNDTEIRTFTLREMQGNLLDSYNVVNLLSDCLQSLPVFGTVFYQSNTVVGCEISLIVSPRDIQFGGSVCSNVQVVFTCIADDVAVIIWSRNNMELESFTLRDTAPTQKPAGEFTLFLNSSVFLTGGTTRNTTSSLVANSLSDLSSGDVIGCADNSGQSITLNFTTIETPPPKPEKYTSSIVRSSEADNPTFVIDWNEDFNTQYGIEGYMVAVSGHPSINCSSTCSPSEECVCSGLFAGKNVLSYINISALNCDNQEGAPEVFSIKPLTPEMPSFCRILPVYNVAGQLIDFDISWNSVSNPGNFSSKLSQNVLNYSLSLDGSVSILPIETSCRDASKMCSVRYYSYYYQPSNLSRLSLNASVTAENIIGTGPSQMCTLPYNGIIAPNNILFTIDVMPAEGTVACNPLETVDNFTCEFCYRLETCEVFTDQDCTSGDVTLTRTSGSYCYQATAFRNGIPIAIVNGSFLISPAAPDVPKALFATSIAFFVLAVVLVAIILIAWLLYYCLGGESAKPPVKITVTIIVLFVIAILSVSVSLFLLLAYSSNKSGATGRNLLAASLSFSLLSLVFTISSMIVIIIIYKRKTKSETVSINTDLKKGNTEEVSDEDEHEGVEGYKLDY